jgi:hypothetical protein
MPALVRPDLSTFGGFAVFRTAPMMPPHVLFRRSVLHDGLAEDDEPRIRDSRSMSGRHRAARRIVILTATVLAISSAMPTVNAASEGRTFVINNCLHRITIRPRYILFACGDGAFYVRGMDWQSWHPFRALGHGTFHQNDCDPSCAEGTFHTVGGRLLLKGREPCPRVHHFLFTRAVITFDERFLGRRRIRAELVCPG